MSKILEEGLCPPCFTCSEEYQNLHLSRKWLDCVEIIRSVNDGYGVNADNAIAFLYALANEVANQIEAVKHANVCSVCGCYPCRCAELISQQSQPEVASTLPITKPEVTIDFAAESACTDVKYSVGNNVTVTNKNSALFGKKVVVSSVSKDGSTIRVKKNRSDSEEFEFTAQELKPNLNEDLQRLKQMAGIRG